MLFFKEESLNLDSDLHTIPPLEKLGLVYNAHLYVHFMKSLLKKSAAVLNQIPLIKSRFLKDKVNWINRLTGIKGARGTKTTLILQQLMKMILPATRAAYFSLDDIYFTTNSLAETIENYYKQGGTHLFLDEIHKYPDWSRHLKKIMIFISTSK